MVNGIDNHQFIAIFQEEVPGNVVEQAKSLFDVLAISDRVLLIRTPIDDPKPISNFFGMDGALTTMQLSMDAGAGDVLPEPREPNSGHGSKTERFTRWIPLQGYVGLVQEGRRHPEP